MLADVAVKIEFAKPAVYRAAYSLSENNPKSALHCAHAKFMCAQVLSLHAKIVFRLMEQWVTHGRWIFTFT